MVSTEFHFLTLRKDRLQALSRLNGSMTQDMSLRKDLDGAAKGLVRDTVRSSIWAFTESSIYQVCNKFTIFYFNKFGLALFSC